MKKRKKPIIKKKTKINESPLPVMKPTVTVLDQIKEKFIVQVMQLPANTKISNHSKLENFYTDKRFAKEFKEMYLNKAQAAFGLSILKFYDKPIVEIIKQLRDSKMKALYYNWPTTF
jgi:hypothetical protein